MELDQTVGSQETSQGRNPTREEAQTVTTSRHFEYSLSKEGLRHKGRANSEVPMSTPPLASFSLGGFSDNLQLHCLLLHLDTAAVTPACLLTWC